MRFPPLTIALTAVSICSGVTVTLCPKPMRARSTFLTYLRAMSRPALSPGRSTPVFLPSPNALKY